MPDTRRKSILKALLSLIIVFSVLFICEFPVKAADGTLRTADDSSKVVRVGYMVLENYQEGVEDQRKSGLGYEYLQKIASYTGWEYEYVYGNLTELLTMLADGEIDLMGNISYTEERSKLFNYAYIPAGDEKYWIYSLTDNTKIVQGKKETLNNKKIGCLKDSYQLMLLEDWVENTDLNAEIVLYSSQDELLKDYYSGNVDAAAMATEQAKGGYETVISLGESDVYYVVSKNRDDILEELNEALTYISQIEPKYNSSLEAKYYNFGEGNITKLSKSESEWLEQQGGIIIGCVDKCMPYSAKNNETGEPDGIIVDIIDALKNNLEVDNLEVKVIFYDNYTEAFEACDSGEVDCLFPVCFDGYIAETRGKILSDEVINAPSSLVFLNSFNTDKMNVIASIEKSPSEYYIRIHYPESTLVTYDSYSSIMTALKNGDASSAIISTYKIYDILKNDISANVTSLPYEMSLCLTANNTNPQAIRILNRAIATLDAEKLNARILKYTSSSQIYTSKDFISDYQAIIIGVIIILAFALASSIAMYFKLKKTNEERREQDKRASAALSDALNKAQTASMAKSTFLFNMSHDIRTPMNAIMGFTDRAIKHKDNEEILDDSLNKVKEASEYLLHIINDVLDMARIESGKMKLIENIIDIKDESQKLIEIIRLTASPKDITVYSDTNNISDKYLWADMVRLQQIAVNLLTNSIKYTNQGGEIHYTMEQVPGKRHGYATMVLTVQDNGIGMSKDFISHIFEQFSRASTSTISRKQGTGLGMSIVKQLVDMMGGSIVVDSKMGKGTTVTVTVTLKVATEEEINNFIRRNTPEKVEEINLEGKKVLLVEDNEMNREIARDILEDKGIIVDEAEDGLVAVKKMLALEECDESEFYDFILMDVQMPNMNGYEATRQIRTMGNRKLSCTPIFAMTANAFEEDKQNALEAGMNAHIAKPLKIEVLWKTINEVIK